MVTPAAGVTRGWAALERNVQSGHTPEQLSSRPELGASVRP
jgi:hypothetical protein